MILILKIQIDITYTSVILTTKQFRFFFECFHNPGMNNSFDLKTIARATATVYRKIVKAPKPRKETKIKHQRAAW